ncbi:hypothetical protein M123_3491 [Bacteroides fragilis str. 3976T8]|uniref:Uncharacterized protein n=1 Tax=Bacteroides fragilis str. 3976T8 TaxID=1339314 RepID=A0A016BTI8_BACFG|nr:hypothetical protein M123_3491 [Bacteroides fragilis str. 3976T8]
MILQNTSMTKIRVYTERIKGIRYWNGWRIRKQTYQRH